MKTAKASPSKAAVSKAAPAKAPVPPTKPVSAAAMACHQITLAIRAFEHLLDGTQEIAMGFAGSDAGVLKIEGLGHSDPDLISFYGRDESGAKTQLIQHVSQLSVMLRAIPKTTPEQPPRRIGFRLNPGWKGGESGDGSA